MELEDEVFPLDFLQPKHETQLDAFLAKHPSHDGRGVLIGILDTGVDIAVPGMQVTSEGKPKVLDVMDCSGAGDVDTSAVRRVDDNGVIVGLTGRKLKIPSTWRCPSGEFHVGVKVLFELFGKALKERVKKRRKETLWEPAQRTAVANAKRALEVDETAHKTIENLDRKWAREELLQQVDSLKTYDKDYDDCGLTADCVVFNDGQTWQCCIDTSFRGDLDKCQLLGVFRDTHQFARYSDEDLLTYAVNVHNNGNLLEIFAPSHSHGTHVAGIAAACFPENAALNGVAPGAQIVSLAICDGRLGSMETGTALARALNRCVELGVHVINYSFGESTNIPNAGRIISYIEQTVNKHGILFVSSAGNNGPALSTTGCPGSTTSSTIGVGAYLSTAMAAHMYSVRDKIPPTLYPWSANGPAANGSLGVCVSAPGAAVTCMPKWTLRNAQLLNGTSMSSPHVAGSIACLLSGLQQLQLPFSPYSIRQAIENTAKFTDADLPNRFAIGHGLLQTDKALDYLVDHSKEFIKGLVRYNITIGGDSKQVGIYLRDAHKLTKVTDVSVTVNPVFHEDTPNDDLTTFSKHLVLVCDAPWVLHPKNLELSNVEKTFNIRIDPAALLTQPSSVHFTQILAYDTSAISAGPLWRVPITVIVPDEWKTRGTSDCRLMSSSVYSYERSGVTLAPAQRHRHFIHVPHGADWAVIRLSTEEAESNSRFVLHTVQLTTDESYRTHESFKMLTLTSTGECALSVHVIPERTLELCITKWWASLAQSTIKYSIKFHGASTNDSHVCMMSSDVVKKLDCTTYLRSEELSPTVTIRQACLPVRPVSHKLCPLGPRDIVFDGKQLWSLTLTYNFNTFPGLSEYLYENEFDSQLWQIHTINKEYCATGDAYPVRSITKLAKGDYKLTLCLRHDSESRLEQFTGLPAVLVFKLASSFTMDVYDDYGQAMSAGKKCSNAATQPNTTRRLYIRPPPDDKLPTKVVSWLKPGCYLEGTIVYPKDEYGRRASQWPFRYLFTEALQTNGKKNGESKSTVVAITAGKKAKRSPTLPDTVRDARISWITKMTLNSKASKLYEDLKTEFPAHLPVYLTYLRRIISNQKSAKQQQQVLSVADKILSLVDQERLLRNIGCKTDLSQTPDMLQSDMDTQKDAVIEALVAKGSLLVDAFLLTHEDDAIKQLYSEMSGQQKDAKSPTMRAVKSDASVKSADNSPREGAADSSSLDESVEAGTVDTTDQPDEPTQASDADSPTGDSTASVPQPTVTLAELDEIYIELRRWVDEGSPTIAEYSMKLALAHGHLARALRMCSSLAEEKPSKINDTNVILICKALGWTHIANYLTNWQLVRYPPYMRPF